MREEGEGYVYGRIKSGEFFSDARYWFYDKYVFAYKQKVDLIVILSVLFFVILVFVSVSIFGVFSVSARNGVVDLESDFKDEFSISKIPKYYNNNEKNILRFIIENYVNYFESYDIDQFSIYKLNDKIRNVKMKSTKQVGDKFERIARNNYTAEIFNGFIRKSEIKEFSFEEYNYSFKDKILNKILPENTPTKVYITLNSTVYSDGGKIVIKEEERKIVITFNYKPLNRSKNDEFESLDFMVTSYNYI